jgi:hypothetical protein
MVKAYKGFDKDFRCRGYQFEVGKEYKHEGKVRLCVGGFHASRHPLEVFKYYSPAGHRFCEVELDGKVDESDEDATKLAASDIKVGTELHIKDMINAARYYAYTDSPANVHPILEAHKDNCSVTSKDEFSTVISTGVDSVAAITGDYSAAINKWACGVAASTGANSVVISEDNRAAAVTTGHYSVAITEGDNSVAVNTSIYSEAKVYGDSSIAVSSGTLGSAVSGGSYSIAVTSGFRGSAVADSPESIACGVGEENMAKGMLGCWLVLAEWALDFTPDGHPTYSRKDVRVAKVDGETIKAGTWYKLVKGEFVEVEP